MRPLTTKERIVQRVQCAADYGDQKSLASRAAGGGSPNFGENLVGGNTASGLINLGLDILGDRTPSGSEIATGLLSGGGQGLPGGGAGFKGAVGVLQDAGLAATGGQTAVEVGTGIGALKFAYDAGTVLYGWKVCE